MLIIISMSSSEKIYYDLKRIFEKVEWAAKDGKLDNLRNDLTNWDKVYNSYINFEFASKLAKNLGDPREEALKIVAENGHLLLVKYLLKEMTKMTQENVRYDFDTPLYYAVRSGHKAIINALLAVGADVHVLHNQELYLAAQKGDLQALKKALANGANLHVNNDEALRIASANGHLPIVQALLNAGADVHAYNDKALESAAANGHLLIVKELLAAGANIYGVWDYSPLREAAKGGHLDVVKILLEAGSNIHANNDGALRNAVRYGHLSVVKALLAAGANVHAWNDKALYDAVSNGYLSIVKVLLAAKANIDVISDKELKETIKLGYLPVVDVLIAAGANISYETKRLFENTKQGIINERRKELVRISNIHEKTEGHHIPRDVINKIIEMSLKPKESEGGASQVTYKGRKYKIHVGSKGGKYILVGSNKKVYI